MSEDIHEAAARWHMAQTRDDMDWEAFAGWLEAEPQHRVAFDDVALLDEQIEAARPVLSAAVVPAQIGRGAHIRRWAISGALAATMALAIGLVVQTQPPAMASVRTFASATGKTSLVHPEAGVEVTLGSGSTLSATTASAPLQLAGSGYFAIGHDPARVVTIDAAGYRIRDVGTRFEITSGEGTLRVAVESGAVAIRAPGATIETSVSAGQEALAIVGHGIEVRKTRLATVASWRLGRFVYDDAPLALVAADVSRYTGQPVAVDWSAAGRRFSGVLAAGDRHAMVSALTQLTDLHANNDGKTIRLADRAGG